MDTDFFISTHPVTSFSRESMSTVSKTVAQVLSAKAANADLLDEGRSVEGRREGRSSQELRADAVQSTGWDAYDVWRRFIKEARERRKNGADGA
jgi:hypothetical protein